MCRGRDQQMHMIGHQDIGMDQAAPPVRGLGKPAEIGAIVVVGEKDGLAVIAALDDMGGDAGDEKPRLARHCEKDSGWGRRTKSSSPREG